MEKLSLGSISPKHLFWNVYGIRQDWISREHEWSFIGNPRKDHGFMYVLCDEVFIRYADGSTSAYHAGALLYIPLGCEYYAEFRGQHGDCGDVLANFLISDIEGNAYCLSDRIVCLIEHASELILNDLSKIAEYSTNIKNPSIHTTKVFYALLEKILAQIVLLDTENHTGSVVTPALYYIDNHIGENTPISDLAKLCLLSESAFRKAFKAAVGLSPTQYKIRAKVLKAQDILESTTEITISEIAERLGFYDISYFYRVFGKVTGQTPKKYRNEEH
ncbi:MAG: helix-turn-helix transcriptional regulator [Clostridia bacterium]|nr:helix-turn-helix transcriptional regulator [Clostridia bacterium]